MKITLKNIGIIKNHEIEIGNFTVVCGKNNTGKTYLSYTVYGLLKHLETHKGNETFSVPEFCENIHRVFNINQDEFKETTIEINNTNNIDTIVDFQFDDIKIQRIENDFVKLTISQKKINELNENDEDILGYIDSELIRYFWEKFISIPNIFLLPAERTSLQIFQKEIDANRNKLIGELRTNQHARRWLRHAARSLTPSPRGVAQPPTSVKAAKKISKKKLA